VIKFCTHYIENPPPKEDEDKKKLELSEWDLAFCNGLDQKTLFSVILAANFLDIKPLLDATCLHIALKLKSMTPEEIRKEYVCSCFLSE
jgi:S-phase kinase-associated protein 1